MPPCIWSLNSKPNMTLFFSGCANHQNSKMKLYPAFSAYPHGMMSGTVNKNPAWALYVKGS
jgi:hypothetical protein